MDFEGEMRIEVSMEDGGVFPKLLPVGMANTTKTSATFAGIFDRNQEFHLVGICQQWGR
ncbi:MAG: hypothetical protein VYC82_02095 [Verrucomicrobiota bacterium]|nr:hypothetical protein [Verrucomicrobiota bacterium]